ncbi:MAG TPA: aminomethyl-transferring glycine dehydrogenase subunit GcvPA [Candidatus Dormibacteraeota bacterium]|nr:aminomethyl-transferring glycine dehydrogenase subunit GcvPA [Candidatus Dormibacteraeota bacterium]
MRYIPHSPTDVEQMLAAVGVSSLDDLFRDIPAALRATGAIDLPPGLPEQEVRRRLEALATRNDGATALSFLGAGAYPHFSPALVDNILQRAEFYSAYTPYQPEVSQGTLQAIFEFQTLVAMLFGLEVANASMYDGASATAEAALMALRLAPKRPRVVLARSLHPHYRETVRTYLEGAGDSEVLEAPFGADGRLDPAWLAQHVDQRTCAVIAAYPNVFGVVEDLRAVHAVAAGQGALLVTATAEPLALALLQSPGDCGAEIAVGEGQSFGIPLSYGGPGVGLFATRGKHVRSMPGRLVGEAHDDAGRRGYVLTLATREQHIRRERATSNICTNHGLIALAVTVYLSLLGKHGLARLARLNLERAHAAQARLCADGRWRPAFAAPFFNEFAIRGADHAAALARARDAGVLAGVPLGEWYPELDDALLVAVTEVHAAADIARLAEVLSA